MGHNPYNLFAWCCLFPIFLSTTIETIYYSLWTSQVSFSLWSLTQQSFGSLWTCVWYWKCDTGARTLLSRDIFDTHEYPHCFPTASLDSYKSPTVSVKGKLAQTPKIQQIELDMYEQATKLLSESQSTSIYLKIPASHLSWLKPRLQLNTMKPFTHPTFAFLLTLGGMGRRTKECKINSIPAETWTTFEKGKLFLKLQLFPSSEFTVQCSFILSLKKVARKDNDTKYNLQMMLQCLHLST